MKKKNLIFFTIVVVIIIAVMFIKNNINIKNNKENNTIITEENDMTTIKNNIQDSNNINEDNNEKNNIQNIAEENKDNTNNSLPNDSGLTVAGVPKTYNQDIIAQANIAYLLGSQNISESTNFEDYINKHLPKNGIFISNVTGYRKTDNPYEFIKERTAIMKDMLSTISLTYNTDKNNYLIDNKGTSELEEKINKVISGSKKVIIGFVPEYYVYINDIDNKLQFGGYTNSSYVSLKQYNNIYTFICNPDSLTSDDFFNMIEEISKIAD